MSSNCAFPGCPHPARASGLCASHYQQQARKKPLKPLRPRNDEQPMKRVSLRLSERTASSVRADVSGARDALDTWSAKKERRRELLRQARDADAVLESGALVGSDKSEKKGGRR